MRGININNEHSWFNYHALFAGIEYEYPERQRVIETVPFSNVEYDFSALFGDPVYNKRNVKYKFKFADGRTGGNDIDLDRFVNFLYSLGDDLKIYDDGTPGYYWKGRLDAIKDTSCVGRENGARMIEVTFRCEPTRQYEPTYSVSEARYPDVNGDGFANATDAQLINTAAAHIGAGEPSGLTADQEIKADADRDGIITAIDSQIVTSYSAEVGAGDREDTVDSWADYLGKVEGKSVI